jgi:hypothetical protein
MLQRSALKRSTKPLKRAALKRGSQGITPAKKAHTKVRKESVNAWKKKAWTVFSKWIRERDKYTCYTCGKVKEPTSHASFMHAGHFISRTHNATLFHPDNSHAQYYYCNVRERGNIGEYAYRLSRELGAKRFNALLALGRTYKTFTVEELKAVYERYRPKEDAKT